MTGWETRLTNNEIKSESNFEKTRVLEHVEIWAPDRERIQSGKGYMNKVISFNLREYDGAIALLRSLSRWGYVTDETHLEKGKAVMRAKIHDGVRLPDTKDGHQDEMRLAIRAIQTVLTAQGLGMMAGVRPDREGDYLKRQPIQFRDMLAKAKKGDKDAENRLVSMMAQDRKEAFSALERVQHVYYLGTGRYELPSALRKALGRIGFGQEPTYRELANNVRKLEDRMFSQERIIANSGLAFIERRKQPTAVALRP